MKWYHYLMCFVGGAAAANFFPHFVNGISGLEFPTPFANPAPPIGQSPAPVNVAWALANMVLSYVLLRYGRFDPKNWGAVGPAFLGFAAMAVQLAYVFSQIPR